MAEEHITTVHITQMSIDHSRLEELLESMRKERLFKEPSVLEETQNGN